MLINAPTLNSRSYLRLTIVLIIAAVLTACATQPHLTADDPPGFWSGVLHGFTILFSLIGSIFYDVRIYAFPNSGGWYDFGYFLGAAAFRGGSSAGVRQSHYENEEAE
jgi:hypothetical protein